jgi:hypothetical protein
MLKPGGLPVPAGGGARGGSVRAGGCWRRCSSRWCPHQPSAATGHPSPRIARHAVVCAGLPRGPPIHHHKRRVCLRRSGDQCGDSSTTTTSGWTMTTMTSFARWWRLLRRHSLRISDPPAQAVGLPMARRRLDHHHKQADSDGDGLLRLDGDGSCAGRTTTRMAFWLDGDG